MVLLLGMLYIWSNFISMTLFLLAFALQIFSFFPGESPEPFLLSCKVTDTSSSFRWMSLLVNIWVNKNYHPTWPTSLNLSTVSGSTLSKSLGGNFFSYANSSSAGIFTPSNFFMDFSCSCLRSLPLGEIERSLSKGIYKSVSKLSKNAPEFF